jgi:prepilin-type N-terminal cleavage/methylation domain-containing protein
LNNGGTSAGRESSAGFTLIELMIVIAIIAIIAAIAVPNLLAAKLTSNETAAMATLRSLVSAQSQLGVAARIDADNDGRGEFGTFLELTGSVGTRRAFDGTGSDFSAQGNPIKPPMLSSVMARIDATGWATKAGYCFMILLPDTGDPAQYVHETGPAGSEGLAGGAGKVGVDLAEAYWYCYAQPLNFQNSGNRRFFTSGRGDILQSSNDVARAGGTAAMVQGNSAFLGDGSTSTVAAGTMGRDGDVWKAAN